MKYVKHPIPEEISDKGGASVQLVQKQTIPLDGAIDAALEAHYCIGQKPAIMNNVFGALKSMAAGVRRDGRPRRIDGFLGLYPVFKGKVDLAKGFDPAENKVQIKARLLNELVLNTKKWTFEDVTPGKRSFSLDSVKAGSVLFVVKTGESIEVNGQGLPSTKAGEELRIHWAVEDTDKSGDIPASKMTSDAGRADIAADALAELASEEYDGKTIEFTVRGNFSSAKISAKLKVVPERPKVLITSMRAYNQEGDDRTEIDFTVEHPEGTAGYRESEGDQHIEFDLYVDGEKIGTGVDAIKGPEEDFFTPPSGLDPIETGKTVKIVLHVDPSKTEFDPTDAEAEGEVEG